MPWPGLATVRLRASSVMATAKTPSLNASSLVRSSAAFPPAVSIYAERPA
jgi:hypothetical protein